MPSSARKKKPKPIGRHTVMSCRIDEEDRIEVMSKIPTELIAAPTIAGVLNPNREHGYLRQRRTREDGPTQEQSHHQQTEVPDEQRRAEPIAERTRVVLFCF